MTLIVMKLVMMMVEVMLRTYASVAFLGVAFVCPVQFG